MNDPTTATRNTSAALRKRRRSSDRCSMNDIRASSTPGSLCGAGLRDASSGCGAGLVIGSAHQWTRLAAASADVALLIFYIADVVDVGRPLAGRMTGGGIRTLAGSRSCRGGGLRGVARNGGWVRVLAGVGRYPGRQRRRRVGRNQVRLGQELRGDRLLGVRLRRGNRRGDRGAGRPHGARRGSDRHTLG